EGVAGRRGAEAGGPARRPLPPPAVRRTREPRAAGHRTVLIPGALACFVRPLRPLFDEVLATRLGASDGRFSGRLSSPPVVGEARANWLRQYAAGHAAGLRHSYAYADSHSDPPMLRAARS